jgi:hypothetical protein
MADVVGVSPPLSLGPTVFASLHWTSLAIGVEGWADLPASSATDKIPGARVRTWLLAGGPTVCLHAGEYFGCAIALLAFLSAEAPGVAGTTSETLLEILAGLRAGIAVPLAFGLSVRGSLDVLGNPTRPTVRAAGQDLWQSWPIAGATQVAVSLRIP